MTHRANTSPLHAAPDALRLRDLAHMRFSRPDALLHSYSRYYAGARVSPFPHHQPHAKMEPVSTPGHLNSSALNLRPSPHRSHPFSTNQRPQSLRASRNQALAALSARWATVRAKGDYRDVLWWYRARSRYVVGGVSGQPLINANDGRCTEST
jgi:hypothetical protein